MRDVLDAALATGGDFAELFMEDRRDTSLVLQLNRLETVNSGRIHGAGVRRVCGLECHLRLYQRHQPGGADRLRPTGGQRREGAGGGSLPPARS